MIDLWHALYHRQWQILLDNALEQFGRKQPFYKLSYILAFTWRDWRKSQKVQSRWPVPGLKFHTGGSCTSSVTAKWTHLVADSKKQCFIYTVTAIRQRPYLAHMEVDEQKFPITQHFDIPAPSIYCHKLQGTNSGTMLGFDCIPIKHTTNVIKWITPWYTDHNTQFKQ